MTAPLCFEDVEVGETRRFGRYAVTPEEIVEFARQFDPQPFHLDEVAARQSIFGGLIASGWHTAAMFGRMLVEHAVFGGATAGALGFDDLKWLKPVRPGDVLSAQTLITEKIDAPDRPDMGRVKVEGRVLDQEGETVMVLTLLVPCRRRPRG